MQVTKQVSDTSKLFLKKFLFLFALHLSPFIPKQFHQPLKPPFSVPSWILSHQDKLSPGDRCSGALCEPQGRNNPHTVIFGQLPPVAVHIHAGFHPAALGKGWLAILQVLQVGASTWAVRDPCPADAALSGTGLRRTSPRVPHKHRAQPGIAFQKHLLFFQHWLGRLYSHLCWYLWWPKRNKVARKHE